MLRARRPAPRRKSVGIMPVSSVTKLTRETTVDQDRFRELTWTFLLWGLSGPEQSEWEAELERRGDAGRAEVSRMREALAAVALAAPPVSPPPALRERVRAAIDEPEGGSTTPASLPPAGPLPPIHATRVTPLPRRPVEWMAAAALCFGHADFSLQMGLADADAGHGVVHHARCTVAIAARACGLAPIDSVFLAVRDESGFREDVALGLRLGFDGKLCIHPRQVAIVNDVYAPSAAEVEEARRIVAAAEAAEADGQGAIELDGKMIDAPVVAAKRRVLARASRSAPASD